MRGRRSQTHMEQLVIPDQEISSPQPILTSAAASSSSSAVPAAASSSSLTTPTTPTATSSTSSVVSPTTCCFCRGVVDCLGEVGVAFVGPYSVDGRQLTAHASCAKWTSDVAIGSDGEFEARDIIRAMKRIPHSLCQLCGKPGGCVDCRHSKCTATYHLPCIRRAGGVLVGNYAAAYCKQHAEKAKSHSGGNDMIFQVEKILRTRTRGNKQQFLTKWQGYDEPADATWEPHESFLDTTPIIQFEAEQRVKLERRSVQKEAKERHRVQRFEKIFERQRKQQLEKKKREEEEADEEEDENEEEGEEEKNDAEKDDASDQKNSTSDAKQKSKGDQKDSASAAASSILSTADSSSSSSFHVSPSKVSRKRARRSEEKSSSEKVTESSSAAAASSLSASLPPSANTRSSPSKLQLAALATPAKNLRSKGLSPVAPRNSVPRVSTKSASSRARSLAPKSPVINTPLAPITPLDDTTVAMLTQDEGVTTMPTTYHTLPTSTSSPLHPPLPSPSLPHTHSESDVSNTSALSSRPTSPPLPLSRHPPSIPQCDVADDVTMMTDTVQSVNSHFTLPPSSSSQMEDERANLNNVDVLVQPTLLKDISVDQASSLMEDVPDSIQTTVAASSIAPATSHSPQPPPPPPPPVDAISLASSNDLSMKVMPDPSIAPEPMLSTAVNSTIESAPSVTYPSQPSSSSLATSVSNSDSTIGASTTSMLALPSIEAHVPPAHSATSRSVDLSTSTLVTLSPQRLPQSSDSSLATSLHASPLTAASTTTSVTPTLQLKQPDVIPSPITVVHHINDRHIVTVAAPLPPPMTTRKAALSRPTDVASTHATAITPPKAIVSDTRPLSIDKQGSVVADTDPSDPLTIKLRKSQHVSTTTDGTEVSVSMPSSYSYVSSSVRSPSRTVPVVLGPSSKSVFLIECPLCNRSCKDVLGLQRHHRKMHTNEPKPDAAGIKKAMMEKMQAQENENDHSNAEMKEMREQPTNQATGTTSTKRPSLHIPSSAHATITSHARPNNIPATMPPTPLPQQQRTSSRVASAATSNSLLTLAMASTVKVISPTAATTPGSVNANTHVHHAAALPPTPRAPTGTSKAIKERNPKRKPSNTTDTNPQHTKHAKGQPPLPPSQTTQQQQQQQQQQQTAQSQLSQTYPPYHGGPPTLPISNSFPPPPPFVPPPMDVTSQAYSNWYWSAGPGAQPGHQPPSATYSNYHQSPHYPSHSHLHHYSPHHSTPSLSSYYPESPHTFSPHLTGAPSYDPTRSNWNSTSHTPASGPLINHPTPNKAMVGGDTPPHHPAAGFDTFKLPAGANPNGPSFNYPAPSPGAYSMTGDSLAGYTSSAYRGAPGYAGAGSVYGNSGYGGPAAPYGSEPGSYFPSTSNHATTYSTTSTSFLTSNYPSYSGGGVPPVNSAAGSIYSNATNNPGAATSAPMDLSYFPNGGITSSSANISTSVAPPSVSSTQPLQPAWSASPMNSVTAPPVSASTIVSNTSFAHLPPLEPGYPKELTSLTTNTTTQPPPLQAQTSVVTNDGNTVMSEVDSTPKNPTTGDTSIPSLIATQSLGSSASVPSAVSLVSLAGSLQVAALSSSVTASQVTALSSSVSASMPIVTSIPPLNTASSVASASTSVVTTPIARASISSRYPSHVNATQAQMQRTTQRTPLPPTTPTTVITAVPSSAALPPPRPTESNHISTTTTSSVASVQAPTVVSPHIVSVSQSITSFHSPLTTTLAPLHPPSSSSSTATSIPPLMLQKLSPPLEPIADISSELHW